jgi:acetyl-CoA C-acetyltransferase
LKEKEIAIIGCGMHKFGRFADESYAEIGREAVRMALQDAGIGWMDKQAAYF